MSAVTTDAHPEIRVSPLLRGTASEHLCYTLAAQIPNCKLVQVDGSSNDFYITLTVLAWSEKHKHTMYFKQPLAPEFFGGPPDDGFNAYVIDTAKAKFAQLEETRSMEEPV